MPGGTSEIMYNASQDELVWYIEPMTGSAMHFNEGLQTNYYIENLMFDSPRYANIFSAETDNNDTFVWPYMFIKLEGGINKRFALDFRKLWWGIYGFSVVFGVPMMIVTFFLGSCALMCCDYKNFVP